MNITKQGEKLLLLVRRDSRTTEEIATAMAIDKSYLPRLYKMDILPVKPLKKAMEAFQVPASYFLNMSENPTSVAEPGRAYAQAADGQAAQGQLQAEVTALRDELRRLNTMLEQERAINANLAEALKNLSKRD